MYCDNTSAKIIQGSRPYIWLCSQKEGSEGMWSSFSENRIDTITENSGFFSQKVVNNGNSVKHEYRRQKGGSEMANNWDEITLPSSNKSSSLLFQQFYKLIRPVDTYIGLTFMWRPQNAQMMPWVCGSNEIRSFCDDWSFGQYEIVYEPEVGCFTRSRQLDWWHGCRIYRAWKFLCYFRILQHQYAAKCENNTENSKP